MGKPEILEASARPDGQDRAGPPPEPCCSRSACCTRRGSQALRVRRPLGASPGAAGSGAARERGAGAPGVCASATRRACRWWRAAQARDCPAARMPHAQGVTLALSKLKRILEIDPVARTARVQPGVRNLAISEAAAPFGLYYAPDPSSQIACSIGGNVAENSGGVHCLKYGLTVHNLLKLRVVTIEGDVLEIGSEGLDAPGYDLMALITGSEGLLGGGDRSDRQAAAQAGQGASGAGRIRLGGRRPARRWPTSSRAGMHSGRAGDDGQARDRGGRAVRACRLSAGCRSDPAVRERRHRRRGRR